METTVKFLLQAGIPVSVKPSGLRWPNTCQTWTGWVFDSVRGSVSVTADKCSKARSQIEKALDADTHAQLRAHQLAETAGLLPHIAEVDLQL